MLKKNDVDFSENGSAAHYGEGQEEDEDEEIEEENENEVENSSDEYLYDD